jgi:hypothetical protein
MPHLLRLADDDIDVWPFTGRPGHPRVIEIYPRVMTGRVHKRNAAARAAYVANRRLELPDDALSCEDAFDAAISALVMSRHVDELLELAPARDVIAAAEGEVWVPATDAPRWAR